jgi:hypothetical protein
LENGKEIILNYCKTVKTHDIDHLQSSIENVWYIEKNDYEMLNGCPSTYGLDDYVGFCEIENVGQEWEKQKEQCLKCWKNALF